MMDNSLRIPRWFCFHTWVSTGFLKRRLSSSSSNQSIPSLFRRRSSSDSSEQSTNDVFDEMDQLLRQPKIENMRHAVLAEIYYARDSRDSYGSKYLDHDQQEFEEALDRFCDTFKELLDKVTNSIIRANLEHGFAAAKKELRDEMQKAISFC